MRERGRAVGEPTNDRSATPSSFSKMSLFQNRRTAKALRFQIGVAPLVTRALGSAARHRASTISRRCKANEIGDVRVDRELAVGICSRRSRCARSICQSRCSASVGSRAHFAWPVARSFGRLRRPLSLLSAARQLSLSREGRGARHRDLPRLARFVERDEGELALRHDRFAVAVALAGDRFGLAGAATCGPASAARHRR